jgi:hypothetical protein
MVTGSDDFIRSLNDGTDESTTIRCASHRVSDQLRTRGGGHMSIDLAVGLLNLGVGLLCLYLAIASRA